MSSSYRGRGGGKTYGGGRSGWKNKSPPRSPKLKLKLVDFSEQRPPKELGSGAGSRVKRPRAESPLPFETETEAKGLCLVCNNRLVDDMCLHCLEDQVKPAKKQAKASAPVPLERKLFAEVGEAKTTKTSGMCSVRECRKPAPPKGVCREHKGKTCQTVGCFEILSGQEDDPYCQPCKDKFKPKTKLRKCPSAGCDGLAPFTGYCAACEKLVAEKKARTKEEFLKSHSQAEKGKLLHGRAAAQDKDTKDRLESLPGLVLIVCDEGDGDKEPLLIFHIQKSKITAADLKALESLRQFSTSGPVYGINATTIAANLFGFKGIDLSRESIQEALNEDEKCTDTPKEMERYRARGKWYDPNACSATDPESAPPGDDSNDLHIGGDVRVFRLRKFWMYFNEWAESYRGFVNEEDLQVVWD